jgi:hypothetical protein
MASVTSDSLLSMRLMLEMKMGIGFGGEIVERTEFAKRTASMSDGREIGARTTVKVDGAET